MPLNGKAYKNTDVAKVDSNIEVADKKSYNNLIKKELENQKKNNKNKKNLNIKKIKPNNVGNKLVNSFYKGIG